MRAGTKPGEVNSLMCLTGTIEALKKRTASSIHNLSHWLTRNVFLSSWENKQVALCRLSVALNLFTPQNRYVLTAKQEFATSPSGWDV